MNAKAASGRARTMAQSIDWGALAPLRLRAKEVAEGVYAGAHRSARRGAGVEFGGHREYQPGDDLRWLDRRSLLLHDRLLVRQFETETDRAVRIVVDATRSMSYRGEQAPAAKLAFAALVAAALARLAVTSGDPIGLTYVGGDARPVPVSGGREAFERVVSSLEGVTPAGEANGELAMLDNALGGIARAARRGSIVVVLSDLLDLPEGARERIASVATRGRIVLVVQTLDPDEATFPFRESTRFRALEGRHVVEGDESSRAAYLAALEAERLAWETALVGRGARFLTVRTDEAPVAAVRKIVQMARGGA